MSAGLPQTVALVQPTDPAALVQLGIPVYVRPVVIIVGCADGSIDMHVKQTVARAAVIAMLRGTIEQLEQYPDGHVEERRELP